MRAKSEYPTRHGDQHAPDGSDPIPGLGSSPIVVFEMVSATTNVSQINGTFMGWSGPRPVTSHFLPLTLPVLAFVDDVLQISYFVTTPSSVSITLSYAGVTNFTTGQQEQVDGNTVSGITDGTSDFISWDNHVGGATLLDRTFPQSPKFTVAGLHVIHASLSVDQV